MANTSNAVSVTSNQHEVDTPTSKSTSTSKVKTKSHPSGPPLHKIYALPAPIRIFPLPTFYPNNPVSLFHLVYTWASHILSPPPVEPSVIHNGLWCPETRSVQIKDPKSIRALWEQGFFGKGNYSRSEPNWLKREHARRGKHDGHVAEDLTAQRREERKMMKWDRARKEQEAIQRTRILEAWIAPVGPKELLALPNSACDVKPTENLADVILGQSPVANGQAGVVIPTTGARLNGSLSTHTAMEETIDEMNPPSKETILISDEVDGQPVRPRTPTDHIGARKFVRFSPKVESTTFRVSDPPSPGHVAPSNGHVQDSGLPKGSLLSQPADLGLPAPLVGENPVSKTSSKLETQIVDREHLQLCLEETFYLVFALGALTVMNPATGKPFSASELFTLSRQTSYMPPRMSNLQPDDPFLLHYAVYHHFRSLGWVTRPGIKFGVDWMLYNRGPVFSHAEFAVIVLPAYTHPYWKAEGREPPSRSWHWLHTVNRVQSTALKTLVLTYVDVPPPFDEGLGATEILKRYKVREFIVKRWLSNRNRD